MKKLLLALQIVGATFSFSAQAGGGQIGSAGLEDLLKSVDVVCSESFATVFNRDGKPSLSEIGAGKAGEPTKMIISRDGKSAVGVDDYGKLKLMPKITEDDTSFNFEITVESVDSTKRKYSAATDMTIWKKDVPAIANSLKTAEVGLKLNGNIPLSITSGGYGEALNAKLRKQGFKAHDFIDETGHCYLRQKY